MEAELILLAERIGPFASLILILWAERRVLPILRRIAFVFTATATKVGVTAEDVDEAEREGLARRGAA